MANDDYKLFATDRRGYEVLCSAAQLERIFDHHPELRNFWATVKDFQMAISESAFIYLSIKKNGYHVYYRSKKGRNTELKVVVKFDKNNVGILWAAQPTTVGQRRKGEQVIWPSIKS